MGSPNFIPSKISGFSILQKLYGVTKAAATQAFQKAPPSDIAPGAAVAVAHDAAALSRAVHLADPPPTGVETILQAQMFS